MRRDVMAIMHKAIDVDPSSHAEGEECLVESYTHELTEGLGWRVEKAAMVEHQIVGWVNGVVDSGRHRMLY